MTHLIVRDIYKSPYQFVDRRGHAARRFVANPMPRGIVTVGYFTQRRVNSHDYWLDIEIVVAEAVT